jgi:hypothetical protein
MPVTIVHRSCSVLATSLQEGCTGVLAIDRLEDNVNPVSRIFYAGAVGICTPAAEAQDGGYALGNQVGDEQWRTLLGEAGFGRFRRATETPFNRVFEVRK